MKNNRLIVVLGVHRSGTSAITRGLQVMDVGLGERLIPGIQGNNPKGFWEDIDLNTLDNEMMNAIECDWQHLAAIEPIDVEILRKQGYFLHAVEMLRQKVGSTPVFGIKDPRVAKLLPFWKEVFSHCKFNVSYVMAVRHPLSVVKSLAKRDGFEAAQSYLLWLGHVMTSLMGSAGDKRVLVDYDRLMQSPDHELNRMAKHLDLEINSSELQRYKTEFLEQELRHTVYDLNDLLLDDTCPPIVREVYTALLDVASDKAGFDDLENKVVRWSDEFERLKSPFLLIDTLFAQKMVATQAVAERDGQINTLNQEINTLNQVVVDRDGRINTLTQAVAERDGQINTLNQEINTLNQVVVERDGRINTLTQAVAERDGQVVSLNQALAEQISQINAIYGSYSWRITLPMRMFLDMLFGIKHIAVDVLWNGVQQIDFSMPTFQETKLGIQKLIFTVFKPFLHHTQAYKIWDAFEKDRTNSYSVEMKLVAEKSNSYVEYSENPSTSNSIRLLAFYLPQFHPIPENDLWWGKGFTEWINVVRGRERFVGHYQPHLPGELGFYDLRVPEIQRRQIELAKAYGIGGFVFYFYWFAGKRLLELPIRQFLEHKDLDFPFCLCWANESWSRRWDGEEHEILIEQKHTPDDDLAFIRHVSEYMRDPRYIRVDGKPLLLVYRPKLLSTPKDTAKRWRDACREIGLGEIYLAYTQSFESVDPAEYGFDAAVEFPPNNCAGPIITDQIQITDPEFSGVLYDYRFFLERSRNYAEPQYPIFRGVFPSWDNEARRLGSGTAVVNSSPLRYQEWLSNACSDTLKRQANPDHHLIFINAWNEWAEGTHLEPDQRYGYAYLEATRKALLDEADGKVPKNIIVVSHDAHLHGAQLLRARVLYG